MLKCILLSLTFFLNVYKHYEIKIPYCNRSNWMRIRVKMGECVFRFSGSGEMEILRVTVYFVGFRKGYIRYAVLLCLVRTNVLPKCITKRIIRICSIIRPENVAFF